MRKLGAPGYDIYLDDVNGILSYVRHNGEHVPHAISVPPEDLAEFPEEDREEVLKFLEANRWRWTPGSNVIPFPGRRD